MTIKTISYGKTINIGNYQSIRVEYSADLDAVETLEGTIEKLKMLLATEEDRIKKENGVKK